jgi:hypothetical protein
MPERDDAAERLLREALGSHWDFGRSDPEITSMDELTELILSLNLRLPIKPSDEDAFVQEALKEAQWFERSVDQSYVAIELQSRCRGGIYVRGSRELTKSSQLRLPPV